MSDSARLVSPNPEPSDRINAALHRQYERLKEYSSWDLESIVRNTSEPYAARAQGLGLLLAKQDVDPTELILELLDDAEPALWQSAVRFYPYRCHDVRLLSRFKALLNDDDETVWFSAAVALARAGDSTLMPMWKEWLGSQDRHRRRAAMSCLAALNSPAACEILQQAWDENWDAEGRLELASELLNSGDQRGLPFLRMVADSAQGAAAAVAAMSVFCHSELDGLSAMKRILEVGDVEAQLWTVDHISEFVSSSDTRSINTTEDALTWIREQICKQAV